MSDRRDHVPFDPRFFEKLAEEGQGLSIGETFQRIYQADFWSGGESVSGRGAARRQVQQLALLLPPLLRSLQVEVLLDLPCGDFNALRHVKLPIRRYIGGDIVAELVQQNRERHGKDSVRFLELDLTRDPLPDADLMLCRDCLVHLSFADIERALKGVKQSTVRYLLTTTFTECRVNVDITTGDWRLLNLEKGPFLFPPPLQLLNEGCTEAGGLYADKCLGLWRVEDLPG